MWDNCEDTCASYRDVKEKYMDLEDEYNDLRLSYQERIEDINELRRKLIVSEQKNEQ